MVSSLPFDTILDKSKLKAFADNKIYVIKKLKFVLGRVEKILGKGENAVYLHFLLFFQNVYRSLLFRVVKSWDCVVNS